MTLDRRDFLRAGALALGSATLGPQFWRAAFAGGAVPGVGPYGAIPTDDSAADANGLILPTGFTSRVVAVSGAAVAGSQYVWHADPDGGACFPTGDGGWVYVSNQEEANIPTKGGAGAIRFAADGTVVDAYRILSGTSTNCNGGATPWGTWLSCEEYPTGLVWECDPFRPGQGMARPALGMFIHEAAVVDPRDSRVYMTEDAANGLFYRFTPTVPGDLSAGVLEAAQVGADNRVTWLPIPLPTAPLPSAQVPTATWFRNGEGAWFDGGFVYFVTSADHRVWAYETATSKIEVIYDGTASAGPLNYPDALTVSAYGDVYVAEDPGNLEVCLITRGPDRVVSPFMRLVGHTGSELAGLAFNPAGDRLYVSSMRARGGVSGEGGVTFEVTGPFRLPLRLRRRR